MSGETVNYEVGCMVLTLGDILADAEVEGLRKYVNDEWTFLKLIHVEEASKIIMVFGRVR